MVVALFLGFSSPNPRVIGQLCNEGHAAKHLSMSPDTSKVTAHGEDLRSCLSPETQEEEEATRVTVRAAQGASPGQEGA